ncbi:MAG: hypothetical protein LBC41_01100 [Clostridiales bacterium]|jgi:hypothetical protein|nr:hypothetical protein [Clostridiales bacterium]MDR2749231.1 hypothetical protein [Clostridiales bacterium]
MKGLVELSETESMEVKGGAFDFGVVLDGLIVVFKALIPTIQSWLGAFAASK